MACPVASGSDFRHGEIVEISLRRRPSTEQEAAAGFATVRAVRLPSLYVKRRAARWPAPRDSEGQLW